MIFATLHTMRPSDWVRMVLLALLVSFAGVFGFSYGVGGGAAAIALAPCLVLSLAITLPVCMVILLVNAGLTAWCYASLNAEARSSAVGARPSAFAKLVPCLEAKSIVLFAVIMFALWLPWAIALFPGATNSDTLLQMQMGYEGAHPLPVNFIASTSEGASVLTTDAWFTDHYPVLTTLLYTTSAQLSDALTGSWEPAIAFWSLFQGVVFALELVTSIAWLRGRGAPVSGCFAIYIFCCLVPFVPGLVFFVVKDAFFMMAFIPYLMMLVAALFEPCFFVKRSRGVIFTVLAILLCLTRKTSIYLVGATALLGAIIFFLRARHALESPDTPKSRREGHRSCALPREQAGSCSTAKAEDVSHAASRNDRATAWTMLIQGAVCVVLMFVLMPLVVFPLASIEPSGRQEMLGTTFQQVVRAAKDHGSLGAEEAAIERVLPLEAAKELYVPFSTDSVKGSHDLTASSEDVADYLRAYASVGARYPDSYAAAILSVCSGFIAPTAQVRFVTSAQGHTLGFDGGRVVVAGSETEGLAAPLSKAYATLCSVPGLNLLFTTVLYTLWIPVLLLFFALRNRTGMGVAFIPFAVTLAFCVIGPVYDPRYALPMLFCDGLLMLAVLAAAKGSFKARADARREGSSQEEALCS